MIFMIRSLPLAVLTQAEHKDKAAVNLIQGFPLPSAIIDRRMTDALPEKRAEGSQTLKADFKTHIGHA